MSEDKSESTNDPQPKEFSPKDWGYDMYPERGEKFKPSVGQVFMGYGRENIDKMECEENVYKCFKKSPLVKLLMGALKASGCELDLRRHISCEVCDKIVTGGYDPMLNQIVVCQNNAKGFNPIHGTLVHEMIHMFDFCRHKLDFRNHAHLACTEIRAANLAHCSYLSGIMHGTVSMVALKKQHAECVADRATWAVALVRKLTYDEARPIVESVFTRCYNDLEPLGRRIKPRSFDGELALSESCQLGYDDYV
uniref:Mitochondrial inner membrane protease ATP23 n=1 Tax=Cacopsylla melanoneura TaxID=428564 RepID=A0A8D8PRI6_9HEMI